MTKPIYVLNGPNLNLLGQRQPEIYGPETLDDVAKSLAALAKTLGHSVTCLQSNHEGQLIDWIQEARHKAVGIVINAGAAGKACGPATDIPASGGIEPPSPG